MPITSSPIRRITCLLACVAALHLAAAAAGAGEAAEPLLRFPDVHGQSVVFVHAEDIWTAPVDGGFARRLTDDEGEERHPKFSADGSLIAFTAEIDGNPDVYVMGSDGADVRRLTYHPGRDEVVGWHPVSNKVLFRSGRASAARSDRLFLIAPDGSGVAPLPLHEAGRASYSPDGSKIVYNRIAREDRTWKRYHGGMAQDLWLYDFATASDRRLTDYTGTDRLPMWIDDSVYFASDRDRVLNLYAYRLASGEIDKITDHADYDIRRPSHGGDLIVYEVGGSLWLLDTTDGNSRRIPVQIPTAARETRTFRNDVSEQVVSIDCSPAGGRVAVVARGEVFTVPKKHGPTRNLSRSSGARDKNAAWSPDGEQLAYISDAGGEYEIYVIDARGDDQARRITSHRNGYRHTLRWAPDGSKIAFADHSLSLYYVDVNSSEITTVDRSESEPMDVALESKPISDFAWSPDGRWLAYSKIGIDQVSRLWLHSVEEGSSHQISDGLFNDFGPVFSRDGEHLFFVSNRRFDPTFCDFEWEMVYKDVAGIYALTLRADGDRLMPVRSDESEAAEDRDEPESDDEIHEVVVSIDLDGLAQRIEALPVDAGNYRKLAAAKGKLLYLNGDRGDYNRFEYRALGPQDLMVFDIEEQEESTVIEDIDAFSLSADGCHVAYLRDDEVGIVKVGHRGPMAALMKKMGKDAELADGVLDLSGLSMELDPRAEWRQIFDEAWRMERDFFYDPGMHGLDWPAMKEKYGRLVDRATCRQDLRFIIGELIGELATSHTYVRTGENRREPERVNVGMLGADYEVHAGRYRINKIYSVADWTRGIIPPLTGPGMDVREGEYILAVAGRDVTADREIYAHFQGLAGVQVSLLVNQEPEHEGAREVVVTPLASERWLRYHDWVEHNRQVVAEASDGQIGYLHLPDTYTGSAREFPAYYYGQTTKKGLIIDGRYNGGGLDPDIFLHRLNKKPIAYWTRRYSVDQVTPVYVSRAHMVCLTNRQAGSGGDELPHEFQQEGMGPVIGTRTWGGLVGVSMFVRMIDGSGITAPDYRIYTPDGQWTVENEGVTPDIIVELDPADVARGWDAQLQKGIEVLLAKIAEDPLPEPTHPEIPRP